MKSLLRKSWLSLIGILLIFSCGMGWAAGSPEDEDEPQDKAGPKLVITKVSGSVTKVELDSYREYIAGVTVPPNNFDKYLAWKTSRVICSLGLVYQLTGDEWYLEQMVRMTDQVLSCRNDPVNGVTDYVSGRKLPIWPNYDPQFSVNGQPVYYTNDVQTGMILDSIAFTAQVIIADPKLYQKSPGFGETYLKGSGSNYLSKARFYLDRSQETINALIDESIFFDPKAKLFRFPDNPRMNQVLPGSRGLYSAYNRMFAMGRAMLRVAESERVLDPQQNQATIKRYYEVIQAMIGFWRSNLEQHRQADFTYYTWMYRSAGRDEAPRVEDSGHLGIDVQCLLVFYQLGQDHLGITTTDLQAIANTYLRVMTGPDQVLSNRMDGTNHGKKKTKGDILRVTGLSLVEPKIFDACAVEVLKGSDLRPGVSFAEFLYWRQFR